MKRLFIYILALSGMFCILDGCKKNVPEQELLPPEISVRKPKTYPFISGTYSISYTITNPQEGVSLEMTSKEKWIKDLTADDKDITFTLTANPSEKERSGEIEVSYMGAEPVSVTIKQEGYTEDPIIMATQPKPFPFNGGNGKINYSIINPKDDTELKYSCDADWITDFTIDDKSINFVVGANPVESDRSANIELSYTGAEPVSVTINQFKYARPKINASSIETIGCFGKKEKITYTIENPVSGTKLKASSDDTWIYNITVYDKSVDFLVAANLTGKTRTGNIVLNYENAEPVTISFNQAAYTKSDNNATNLSSRGTANCYIVSNTGFYKFDAVKGNSSTSIGDCYVEVLWISGTNSIDGVGYIDNTIYFNLIKMHYEGGNAVIAAKDISGKILWSWHIWLTDQPGDHVYNNGAGIVMDRNLGSYYKVESSSWNVGFGLYYQWGRKDPFLPEDERNNWPTPVASNATTGTIEYSIANPMTFISVNDPDKDDWLYTSDNRRWDYGKTIYDPCPPGYRVPVGGTEGLWAKAFGTSDEFECECGGSTLHRFDRLAFSPSLTGDYFCAYPCSGKLPGKNYGKGYYWSNTTVSNSGESYILYLDIGKTVNPAGKVGRASGCTIRCQKK